MRCLSDVLPLPFFPDTVHLRCGPPQVRQRDRGDGRDGHRALGLRGCGGGETAMKGRLS